MVSVMSHNRASDSKQFSNHCSLCLYFHWDKNGGTDQMESNILSSKHTHKQKYEYGLWGFGFGLDCFGLIVVNFTIFTICISKRNYYTILVFACDQVCFCILVFSVSVRMIVYLRTATAAIVANAYPSVEYDRTDKRAGKYLQFYYD